MIDADHHAERVRLAEAHLFPFLTLVEERGATRAFAFGRDGVVMLPEPVRAEGFAAIDALAAYLRGLWPQGGVGQSLAGVYLDRYAALLGIEELVPRLRPRVEERDAAALIEHTASQLKQNPMLVVLAAELAAFEATAPTRMFPFLADPAAEEDLRDAVAYSALLGAIGLECLLAPKPATEEEGQKLVQARLVEILGERLDGMDWKAHCDLFERLKIALVIKPMRERLATKQGDRSKFDDKPGGGVVLQLNVLDAMYGDTHLGNDDNAECGFELMCQTYDKEPEPLLGEALNEEWTHDGVGMGVPRTQIAFNDAWVSLYSTWNGCFCANYADLMYAKLYNPGVSGAALDLDPAVYLFTRVCTLYVHLHVVVFSRVQTGRRDLRPFHWEDPALRVLWGRINRVAGDAYQARIEAALAEEPGKLAEYRAWRAGKLAMWVPLRAVVRQAARVGEGVDDVVEALRRIG